MADSVAKCHPIVGNPSASAPVSPTKGRPGAGPNEGGKGNNGWAEWTPTRLRQRRSSVPPMLGPNEDESDSDSGEELERSRENARVLDRELAVMRRVFGKWCRLAGVRGNTCDELPESECEVAWTRAIAPRVEGRIQMVGSS